MQEDLPAALTVALSFSPDVGRRFIIFRPIFAEQ